MEHKEKVTLIGANPLPSLLTCARAFMECAGEPNNVGIYIFEHKTLSIGVG